jgi:Tol biopolymer transport system component
MRKLALLALAAATAVIPAAGPKPNISLIFTLKGHWSRQPAATRDGRRIYYLQDSTELYVYDRTTGRSSHVLANVRGDGWGNLALSPAGDRLAFCRMSEDGDGPYLWTVTLDPAGLPNAAPRRVSTVKAVVPTFSPDGKSIAFAAAMGRTAKNLIVVPASGGPERTLAETEGDIVPIRWIDKDSIDFGLSFTEQKDASKHGVYRVALSGGAPRLVVRTGGWGAGPGLSPDGRFIVASDSTWDSLVVVTPAGQRLVGYEPDDGNMWPDVWLSATHAVGARPGLFNVLHFVNLRDGKDRIVSDTGATYMDPQWSPDGRHLLSLQPRPSEIIVSDANGGARRRIPLSAGPVPFSSTSWSPDGHSILYRELRGQGAINMIDAASGTRRQLAPATVLGPAPHWRSDSRAVLYALVDPVIGPDSIKTVAVHEITTAGQDRVVNTVKVRCSGGPLCGKFVNDSLLSTWAGGEYYITNFRAGGAPRLVFTRAAAAGHPAPTFSSDGLWMAVRHLVDGKWSIELMKLDGSAKKTIPVPFAVASGGLNPWIRPDGSELIIASNDCAGIQPAACTAGRTFYRVDVATGRATAVATTPKPARQVNDYHVSADGQSLVYIVDVQPYVDFFDFDFSEMLKGR